MAAPTREACRTAWRRPGRKEEARRAAGKGGGSRHHGHVGGGASLPPGGHGGAQDHADGRAPGPLPPPPAPPRPADRPMASGAGLGPQHGRVRAPARPPGLGLRRRTPGPAVEGSAPPAGGERGLGAPRRQAEPDPGGRAGGAPRGDPPPPAPQGLPAPPSTNQYKPVRTSMDQEEGCHTPPPPPASRFWG